MKKALLLVIALLQGVYLIYSQESTKINNSLTDQLTPMSAYDSLKLSQLPEFRLPEEATRRLLPYKVDNSVHPWFRPLVSQVGLECGQASSIGVVFTYEMNYARNVPGNVPENQYATHFAYNFINGGSDAGVSFFETYEILKKAGNPTVSDYGGMATGGPSRWMDGYDRYYNAMHNRVTEVYAVKVNTVEGLQTIKNWLFDHGNGSSAGGLGCFYAEFTHPAVLLPEGTEEAGKHCIYQWGYSANHAMSIVGYNDSIRWDYNGDGRYTNNQDINFDGVIDIRDWEIGGFKMANTFGSISGWGDQGFSYMMYKSVADAFQEGGIWNNTVAIIDVKDNYEPQLTAKVSLNYGCRNQLRVMAGVSNDINASEPEHILHFPIFAFQGGCQPMQGQIQNYNIEFGLDLNLLLQYVTPGEAAKYFLLVQENDPLGSQSGTLQSFAVIDYTNGGAVINSQVSDLPLVNNGITMATVTTTVNHDPVQITTDSLTPVQLYTNFSQQIQSSQGTPPYRYRMVEDYIKFDSSAQMPVISATKLSPTSNYNGKAKVVLPFEFPFFGEKYTEVYATVDGYLMFENSNLPWPFDITALTYFLETQMIAPCSSSRFVIANSSDGIWYEASEGYVTFRWKLTFQDMSESTLNATARLYPDGKIEFTYGDINLPYYVQRYIGISKGNGEDFEIMSFDATYTPQEGQFIRFTPSVNHDGIELSEDGLLSGLTTVLCDSLPLNVCVTDKYNLKDYKTFYLTTEGLLMDFEVLSGNDNTIGFGENAVMTLHITNLNNYAVNDINFNLSTFDPYYSITDGQESLSYLEVGQSITIDSAFAFKALNAMPNNHNSQFQLTAANTGHTWARSINLTAYRAVTSVTAVNVLDGNNGIPEPGETMLLEVDVMNTGGAELTNATGNLTIEGNFANIYMSTVTIDTLQTGELWHMVYGLSLTDQTPLNDTLEFFMTITGDHGYNYLKVLPLYTGLLVEDFETGDFSSFNWSTGGHNVWFIEQGAAFEGEYCATSGEIGDNENSNLSLQWNVAFMDSISFWYKVSSEPSYDFLHFFIGNTELGKWSGSVDWTKASYMIPPGENLLIWKYTKDISFAVGDDCARIDYVVLPAFAVYTPSAKSPMPDIQLNLYPNPARDELNISFNTENPTPVRILIIDNNGKTCYDQQLSEMRMQGVHTIKTDLSRLTSGVYTVIFVTDSAVISKKLIRTR